MYLCMSFVSYDNNNYILISFNVVIQLYLTCARRQLASTHDSDRLEISLAALVTVHN